ncbi:MAG: class I SAM-dependent methyltransferase, partial [Chloroflexota bacterium]
NLIPSLRRDYISDETSAAIETVKLRKRAVEKFGDDAAVMLFTDDALQQASHPAVRRWRAENWRGDTIDVCCSIGTDAFAFARAGNDVTGVDIDPVRIAMARHNAEILGLSERVRFVVGDVAKDPLPIGQALFYDPARRDAFGNRIYDVERYVPSLSLVRGWETVFSRWAAKLSPGVDIDQVQDYPAFLTFISFEGELKEAQLTAGAEAMKHAAVRLTRDGTPLFYGAVDAQITHPTIEGDVGHWLCEPDPAIIRAGYVEHLASELGGQMLDQQIAYFTTEAKPNSPWVRAWEVQDWMPFHLKRLRAYLRARDVGRVTVKKRGSPLTPEGLTAKLKLKGENSRTLVLTRLRDDPIVVICADYLPE